MASGRRVNGLINKIRGFCEDVVLENGGRLILRVRGEKVLDLCRALRKAGFDHVKGVTGIDYPVKHVIEITYYVGSYSNRNHVKLIVELKVDLPRKNPVTPSLTSVWESCEYHERETYEMFKVIFQGHPKLRPLLLPDNFEEAHPLRKEFTIPEEGIEI